MPSTRRFVHRILPLLLCSLAMVVASCGNSGGNTPAGNTGVQRASADKQILISPIGGKDHIKTLDPALAYDIVSIGAIDMIYTGLVSLDDKLQVKDQLAASHSVDADGTTYTFKLKPGLQFSDGKPLTATDVAYSIDRALQPATKSGTASFYLGLIKDSDKLNSGAIKTLIGDGVLAPDDQTVVIKTSKRAAYFLEALTYPSSYVIEKSMIDKYGNDFAQHLSEGIGGAGPFKVLSYTVGKDIQFVPNDHYYGKKAQLRKVVMPFYKESDTVYKAYVANQVDSSDIPSEQLAKSKTLKDQYHEVPQLWSYYFGMNYLTKPFNNIKIRQAFALAIDKDAIAHNIYKDTVIATNHIVPQGMPGYNTSLTGPEGASTKGDQAKAKELFQQGMTEEGYTLATFPSVTLTKSNGGGTDSRNEIASIQQMWQQTLGVQVKINEEESSKYFDDVDAASNNPKGLQMWSGDWIGDYPDPQDWMTLLFDKGAAKNNMNYGQNPTPAAAHQQQVQQMLEAADAVTNDDTARMKQYNDAEQLLVNDVVWIPRYQIISTYLQKPCVVGTIDNSQNLTPPEDWGDIYISTSTACANTSSYA
jgi:oligopeptide transport system substrate-binding protein